MSEACPPESVSIGPAGCDRYNARWFAAEISFPLMKALSTMNRLLCVSIGVALLLSLTGCGPDAPKTPAAVPTAPAADSTGEEKSATDTSATGNEAAKPAPTKPGVLELDRISFLTPAGWKRVEPPSSRIVEAEFQIPRSEGDEFDGRLTLMAAGGDNDANIARWNSEFIRDPNEPTVQETIKIGEVEAQWIDIRGEWKGSSFAPISPRAEYRMLAVIVPLTEYSSFFIKLVGPRQTLAAHEKQFQEFVKSARIKPRN